MRNLTKQCSEEKQKKNKTKDHSGRRPRQYFSNFIACESPGNLVKMQILFQQVCVGPRDIHLQQGDYCLQTGAVHSAFIIGGTVRLSKSLDNWTITTWQMWFTKREARRSHVGSERPVHVGNMWPWREGEGLCSSPPT